LFFALFILADEPENTAKEKHIKYCKTAVCNFKWSVFGSKKSLVDMEKYPLLAWALL